MNPILRRTAALLAASLFLSHFAYADHANSRTGTYEVTIVNVTKGQVFSPPVLVTHSPDVALFEAGMPALDELALVAEDGAGQPLVDLVQGLPEVFEAQATTAPLMPGASAVYAIDGSRKSGVLSVVGMLVNTNDAFFAVDSVDLPRFPHLLRVGL